jgi:hypothetical protein
MKKLTLFLTILFVSFALLAQKETTRSLSSFTEISVNEGIDVYLKEGSKEEARIQIDGNIEMSEVLTEVSGGKLKIHLDGNNHRNVDVTIWVTYKSLNAVSVSSAGTVSGQNRIVSSGDFKISVSSAGDLELDIKAKSLDINASSAGDASLKVDVTTVNASASSAGSIDISGAASSIEVEVSSSGSFDGYDLAVDRADVSASSGGSANVTVNEQLDAQASSGGSIKYKGNPRMDISTSSGGSIRKS